MRFEQKPKQKKWDGNLNKQNWDGKLNKQN